ncbi:MAG: hypothetical protein AVDCRST_MAG87-2487, partial [uncultured Thermomicrobiales bacterium]
MIGIVGGAGSACMVTSEPQPLIESTGVWNGTVDQALRRLDGSVTIRTTTRNTIDVA